jgi:ABC-2 type transport system ATP-binding protein
MEAALKVEKLVKKYGELAAVDGLDLEVRRGECFGLLGPNGAGKTTTVEILEGLNDPTDGAVEVLGMRWERDDVALRQRLGISLQETHLPDKLTVEETLGLFRSFYAQGRPIDEVLGLVELTDKRKTWTVKLSGGQKQRLAVACALVSDPELLFLDEPFEGVDAVAKASLTALLGDLVQRRRLTVFITSHVLEVVERLCDQVGVIHRGRLVAQGSLSDVVQAAQAASLTDAFVKLVGEGRGATRALSFLP